MLYSTNTLTREDLKEIPVPPRGDRSTAWAGIQHGVLADLICEEAARRDLAISSEVWSVDKTGNTMWGSVTFKKASGTLPNLTKLLGHRTNFSLGVRHCNNSKYALTLSVGARVFVCSNGVFTGDFILKHKHTKLLSLENMIKGGYDQYLNRVTEVEELVASLSEKVISNEKAAEAILESVQKGVLLKTHAQDVYQNWCTPAHEEFEPRTAWSLYNAFTERVKELAPPKQMVSLKALKPFFQECVLS